jgi:hypothetical protein
MEKYAEIIKLLERIFGKGTVARSIGTRTNVTRFPRGPQGLDPTTRHFDVAGTAQKNPELVNTIKNSVEDRIGDLHNMNDQELLNYKQNLQRLDAHLNPPSAEVIAAGSKQPVTGEGLEKLINEQGLKNSPKTIAGQLEQKVKQLEQTSKDLEKTAGQKLSLGDLLQDFAQSNKIYEEANRQGLIRATARQILEDDINAGKIKGLTIQDLKNTSEPINSFREIYGEGALEQLNSLTPEFNQLRSEKEAADLAKSKYKFEPNESRPKESYTEEEMNELLKKPTEPEEKADGGSIGLDYLMGIDNRPKYASGGDVKKILDIIAKANQELKGKKAMEVINPKTGEIIAPTNPIKLAEEPKKEYLKSKTLMELEPEYRKVLRRYEGAMGVLDKDKMDFQDFKQEVQRLSKIGDDIKAEYQAKKAQMEKTPLTDIEQLQATHRRAANAHEEVFPDFNDPKTAAQELAEVMAEQKYGSYGKGFDDLPQKIKSDLYNEAYSYVNKINKLPKRAPSNMPVAPGTEDEFTQAMQEGVKRSNEMKAMGLDPANSKDYDKYLEMLNTSEGGDKLLTNLDIKTKYKGLIDDDLLQKIMVDDNPQRQAEVMATIDEALKMQEKGMSAGEIIDAINNTTRTKQAKGGPIGLDYLLGF